MGTTNILDLNNRVSELAGSYPADKVMMSDGVTSVENRLLTIMKDVEFGIKNCNIGSDSPTNAVSFAKAHATAPSIVLTNSKNPRIQCGTRNYTANGFDLVCYNATASTANIDWIAIWV